jgi:HEAT repeat protein
MEEALAHARGADAGVWGELVSALTCVLGEEARANAATGGSGELRAAAYAELVALLDGPSDSRVEGKTRLAALHAVAAFGDVAAIPSVVRAVDDDDAAVAAAADRWLARICWSPGKRGERPTWQSFFCTDDGKKMLAGSFAKLGAVTDGR